MASLIIAIPAAAFASALEMLPEPVLRPAPALYYISESEEKERIDPGSHTLTIVHFWATWCTPCLEELPQLDRVRQKLEGRSVGIYALSLDRNMQKVADFYIQQRIALYPLALDDRMKNFSALGGRGLPTTYFIDRKGMIVAVAEGPLDWESEETQQFLADITK